MTTYPFEIKVSRIKDDAKLPVRSNPTDAGADLFALGDHTIAPGERKLIPTGIALAIPPDFYGRIAPRSGNALKLGLDIMAGVVDTGYRGEVQVLAINLGQHPITIKQNDRIAQLIIERIATPTFVWAELDETERQDKGFGSSDPHSDV